MKSDQTKHRSRAQCATKHSACKYHGIDQPSNDQAGNNFSASWRISHVRLCLCVAARLTPRYYSRNGCRRDGAGFEFAKPIAVASTIEALKRWQPMRRHTCAVGHHGNRLFVVSRIEFAELSLQAKSRADQTSEHAADNLNIVAAMSNAPATPTS